MSLPRFGVDRGQRGLPSLALRQQFREAIAVPMVLEHLLVDIGGKRHVRTILGLWYDTSADRAEGQPFRLAEEAGAGMYGDAFVDGSSRRLIPGKRVAFLQDIVARKAVCHRSPFSISVSAAMPARARPAKLGGAGIGGPATTFWRQFFQPPIARETP